ncbi:MAG TPA: SprT family zinc-dependent metalloprotease [Candidatus Pacearchaeota archaeon]|nr:SprT family zinc-dependent metalloprotease [Candidatus Pacearchaeota archaeon]
MSSKSSSLLQIGAMEVLVVRKPIKNLHLAVLPPDGKIRVSSPVNMKDDAIRTLISTRIPWIKKQRRKFSSQERQTARGYVTGESHYFLGKRYRLEVVYKNESSKVILKGNNKIVIQVRPGAKLEKREEAMLGWYRESLKLILDGLFSKWQKKIGVMPKAYSIKKMKTRWGTCGRESRHIWMNLELVKKPINCIEYVTVHELLHLIEKKHNENFVSLMTKFQPNWRETKDELNRLILAYEKWNY